MEESDSDFEPIQGELNLNPDINYSQKTAFTETVDVDVEKPVDATNGPSGTNFVIE